MAGSALQDFSVLDLSSGVAGGFCTKLLSGFGADVIKIEPLGGEALRDQGPFPNDQPDKNASAAFLQLNTAKRSVTVNLDTETGRKLLRELAARVDVIVESFAPGYLDGIGAGYADLSAEHPDLVMVSISPFGQDGPYRDYVANELVVYAVSGYLSITGDPDREPHKAYGEQTAIHAGYQSALATVAALVARDVIGRGQHVDVSHAEAAAFLVGGRPPDAYRTRGVIARRNGARLIGGQPTAPYPSTMRPCKDGWVHVHTNYRYPELMGEMMEEPGLNDPEVLATPTGHADEIDEIVDEWLAQYDKWEVVRIAQANRQHFTEVMTPAEVLNDEAYRERDFWFTYTHPTAGEITQPGPVVRLSETPWVNAPAPALGEHNAEVLSGELGYSPQDLVALRERGII
jgi:crotonobetainyl-CoA:carnitine CoA-transferase CaiB-like acyl-CoA transferase